MEMQNNLQEEFHLDLKTLPRALPRGTQTISEATEHDFLVAEPCNHRILVLDGFGQLKFAFGGAGQHVGNVLYPVAAAYCASTSELSTLRRYVVVSMCC